MKGLLCVPAAASASERASGSCSLLVMLVVMLSLWLVAGAVCAADLVIANVRVIVGTGEVIEQGSVIVHDGRIASVAAGAPPSSARGDRIDATGMTVIAGYIDCHRHLLQAPGPFPLGYPNVDPLDEFLRPNGGAAAAMRDLLEAGFTTVLSGGDDPTGVIKLKQMIEGGAIKGPRLLSSAPVPSARLKSEDEVRAAVDRAVELKADSVAEVVYPVVPWPFHPPEQESRNFAAGADQAKKRGILFQVHAVSPDAMAAAAKLGARRFVHSTHYSWMTKVQAREVASTGAIVASSTNVPGAIFNVFSHDDKPYYRSGRLWPDGDTLGEEDGRAAAYMPLNLRTLFDNGVEIAFSGDALPYTTHTPNQQTEVFNQELKTLNLVFSPADMITIIGRNSAHFVDRSRDLGTLEVGKLGDIVVLRGNPLDGYWNFLRPVLVIKGGEIVVDRRR